MSAGNQYRCVFSRGSEDIGRIEGQNQAHVRLYEGLLPAAISNVPVGLEEEERVCAIGQTWIRFQDFEMMKRDNPLVRCAELLLEMSQQIQFYSSVTAALTLGASYVAGSIGTQTFPRAFFYEESPRTSSIRVFNQVDISNVARPHHLHHLHHGVAKRLG